MFSWPAGADHCVPKGLWPVQSIFHVHTKPWAMSILAPLVCWLCDVFTLCFCCWVISFFFETMGIATMQCPVFSWFPTQRPHHARIFTDTLRPIAFPTYCSIDEMEHPTLFFEQEGSRSELFSLTRATLEITLANTLVCLVNRQTHTLSKTLENVLVYSHIWIQTPPPTKIWPSDQPPS